jgi:hypothetical protein
MGLFGKGKVHAEQDAKRLRGQYAAAETAIAERDLQRNISEAERWGFDRKAVAAPGGDEASIDLRFGNLCAEYIEPFRKGALDLQKLAAFLHLIATDEGHPEIARTHPEFPALVLQVLQKGTRDWWPSVALKPAYRFSYPGHFHLIFNHLDDVDQSFLGVCRPAALGIGAIALLDEQSKSKAKGALLEAAKQASLFDLIFLACVEYGWVEDLESVLRQADRFDDVLKVLLFQKKGYAVVEWLRQHGRHLDSVKVLEALGRFGEAAEVLQKLGPEAAGCSEKALAKESGRLMRLAAFAPSVVSAAGEAAGPELARSCSSCGKAVRPEFRFCPFCGDSL